MAELTNSIRGQYAFDIFRYQYIEPRGKIPCRYLESPQNIYQMWLQNGVLPGLILVREVGGTYHNHVHWVHIELLQADEDFTGTSLAHGIVRHPTFQHSVGDLIWLRSDMPVQSGWKAAPIVNLTKLRSGSAFIRDVEWYPERRDVFTGSLFLTIQGHQLPYFSRDRPSHRFAIQINRETERKAPLPTLDDDYYLLPEDKRKDALADIDHLRALMDEEAYRLEPVTEEDLREMFELVPRGEVDSVIENRDEQNRSCRSSDIIRNINNNNNNDSTNTEPITDQRRIEDLDRRARLIDFIATAFDILDEESDESTTAIPDDQEGEGDGEKEENKEEGEQGDRDEGQLVV